MNFVGSKIIGAGSAALSFFGNSNLNSDLDRTIIAAAVGVVTYLATKEASNRATSRATYRATRASYDAAEFKFNITERFSAVRTGENPHMMSAAKQLAAASALALTAAAGAHFTANELFTSEYALSLPEAPPYQEQVSPDAP